MLRKISTYILICFSFILCTSCFEILEEITLNEDGSGHMSVTFNLSKSKSKLASIMLLDSVNGRKVPSEDDIEQALQDAIKQLKKTDGISNIKKTSDFKNYIFTISCDFKKVNNIDAIFKDAIIQQNKREKTAFNTTNFTFNTSSNIFQRHFTYDDAVKKSFYRLKNEDQKVFDDASYTAIYRFKDFVKGVSNKNAKISPNKKAVMLRISAMDLILGENTLENKIELTK